MGAGALETPLRFDMRPLNGSDKFGRGGGGWTPRVDVVFAHVLAKTGAEATLDARREGRQPYDLTLRADDDTRAITIGDRAVELEGDGRVFNVKSVAPHPKRAGYLLLLGETGGAAG